MAVKNILRVVNNYSFQFLGDFKDDSDRIPTLLLWKNFLFSFSSLLGRPIKKSVLATKKMSYTLNDYYIR